MKGVLVEEATYRAIIAEIEESRAELRSAREAVEVVKMVEELRPGNRLEISIEKDVSGVGCRCEWTDWERLIFCGPTLHAALSAAVEAMRGTHSAESVEIDARVRSKAVEILIERGFYKQEDV